MWPVEIVLLAPGFGDLLGIPHAGKQPAVETFRPQLAVETLNKAVLPWAPRTDIQGLAMLLHQPVLNHMRDELRAVVAAEVLWRRTGCEQPAEQVDDPPGRNRPPHVQCQA